VEIRNTATTPELSWLDTSELVNQIGIALRDVAVHEVYLPAPSDRIVHSIELVQRIYELLSRRGEALSINLERLSAETGWLMNPLLEECLRWPGVTPHVREQDGIRRLQRCWLCKIREHPERTDERLCDECLLLCLDSIARREPPEGVIFFRTYNASRWCLHADSETVMMSQDDYDFLGDGRCEQCLRDEHQRRITSIAL
jgi:hypothetical protein